MIREEESENFEQEVLEQIAQEEEVWVTDDEGDPYDYFRLKIDNIAKIKFEMGQILKMKSKKYKKIDSENEEKLKIVQTYLNETVYPTLGMKTEKLYNEDELDKIFCVGNEYNIFKKPEIGSSLIFEISNNKNNFNNTNLNLIGVSQEYYDATTKILKRSRLEKEDNPYIKKVVHQTIKKKKKLKKPNNTNIPKLELKQDIKLKIKENEKSILTNKNKKRKRRKPTRYKKNSTIIEIKQIKKVE